MQGSLDSMMQLVSFLEPEIQDISDLPGIDAEDSSEEQQVGDGDKQCDLAFRVVLQG